MVVSASLIVEALTRSWISEPAPNLSEDDLRLVAPALIRFGAGALFWRSLKSSSLSRSLWASALQHAYRFSAIESRLREERIEQALAQLRDSGVEPILVKGWAIARLYPEPWLRNYIDIDLCVRPQDLSLAECALKPTDLAHIPVDIHCGFKELDDYTYDEVYARSQLIQLGKIYVRTPCPEDHLRMLCIHMMRHGGCRPLWLVDIAVALETRSSDFDWERCLGRNRRRRDSIACALGLAHQLLGAVVDGTPVAERARALPSWLVPELCRQWESAYPPPRYHRPIALYRNDPRGLLRAFYDRWPNAIEATSTVNGPFNEWPRWPFKIANGVLRSSRFLFGHSSSS